MEERKLEAGAGDASPRKASPVRTPNRGGIFSREYACGPVTKDYGDWALLVCCLVTGMIDAASFSNWGVFCGMQTGNTVILGLSTATVPSNPHAWLTTLVSIASFLVGAFLTFRATWHLMPGGITSNRLYYSSVFLVQALFIILAAGLSTPANLIPHNRSGVTTASTSRQDVIDNVKIVALIPPLAFQSGMTIASSRLLGFGELPVNVLTSTYCDLMGDAALFTPVNIKRNRRVAAVVLLLAGAIFSGWLMRTVAGLEGALWIAAGLKLIIAFATFFFLPRAETK